MKRTVLVAALAAAFLANAALADQSQNANSTSNSGSASQSSSYGNVGNATTNVIAPSQGQTSNANSLSSTSSTSTANNAGNSQSNGSASSINATFNLITPQPTTSTASVQRSDSNSTLRQTVDSTSRNEQVISGEQTQRVEYGGSYTVKNVPSMNAPPLISSNDTCMGSASGGVAVAGFGFSGGATYTDEHCKRIKMSRELWNKGMKAASLAMDCMDRDAREALELTGYICPQTTRAQHQAAEEAQRREAVAEAAHKPAAPAHAAPVLVPGELIAPASLPVAAPPAAAAAPATPVAAAPEASAPAAAVPTPVPATTDRAIEGAALPPAPQPGEGDVIVRRVDGSDQPAAAPRE